MSDYSLFKEHITDALKECEDNCKFLCCPSDKRQCIFFTQVLFGHIVDWVEKRKGDGVIYFLDGTYRVLRLDASNIVLDKLTEKKVRKREDGSQYGGGKGWKRLGFFDKPQDLLQRLLDDAIADEIGTEDELVEVQMFRHSIIKLGKKLGKKIDRLIVEQQDGKDSEEEDDD